MTSDQALTLDYVPKSAIILGGGVIGCEFASVWRSFGADVTIIEGLPHLVPNEDESISKALERAFRKRKINFNLGDLFSSVTQDDNGVHVTLQSGKPSMRRSCSLRSVVDHAPLTLGTKNKASAWTAVLSSQMTGSTRVLQTFGQLATSCPGFN